MVGLKVGETCCLILLGPVFPHVLSDLSDDSRGCPEVFGSRSLFAELKYPKHRLPPICVSCCGWKKQQAILQAEEVKFISTIAKGH